MDIKQPKNLFYVNDKCSSYNVSLSFYKINK